MAGDLFVVGLSWRTAPVAIREKLAFTDDELQNELATLLQSPCIDEGVILSTCNRVEIYGVAAIGSVATAAAAEARHFLVTSRDVSTESVAGKLYDHQHAEAARHVFRVASALDSLVLGETQILGQVKGAYGAAVAADATGQVLNRCLQQAFSVAKRVRTETGVSRGAANVSSVAVELAGHVFGELVGKRVLVIGAGKMSVLAARHLVAAGAGAISVTNRSPERAEELAAQIEGVARPWADLQNLITASDVIITSTASRQPVLVKKLVKPAMKARRNRPVVIIDIAVPRDADASISNLDGVYLFDIDDLQRVVAENIKERRREADAAGEIVQTELTGFLKWQRSQKVVPTIRNLREHFTRVATVEADKVIAALGDNHSPEERERAIRRLGNLIVNKLLHAPMSTLKHAEDPEAVVEVTQRLFDLPEEEVEEESESSDVDTPSPRAAET